MNKQPISRRQLLNKTATYSVMGAGITSNPWLQSQSYASNQPVEKDASKLVTGKDSRMIVLVDNPAVLETPLNLLNEKPITPRSLLFVRNNQQPQQMATLKPIEDENWKIQIQEKTVRLSELKEMPQSSVTMVLQCSGNGRSLFSRSAQTKGTQWGKGGMGCVKIGGVKVSDVLTKLKIQPENQQRYLLAKGVDNPLPDKEDFLHTLPSDEVINRSFLALTLNDEPLSAIHGGPVRLVTPGVYATMNIKWLESLKFVEEESTNYNHLPRYRVPKSPIRPGTDFKFSLKNSNFNWNMKVKSVVLNLTDGQRVNNGNLLVQGVAFNDGTAPIESVLVSSNKGLSWNKAELDLPDELAAWTRFSAQIRLPKGNHEIWTRAVDAFGRSQPLNGSVAWNPRGYEWNGIEKIRIDCS